MFNYETAVYVLFVLALLLLVGLAEWWRHKLHQSSEWARKFVHIATGLLVAVTPFIMHSEWPLVAIGIVFIVINYVAVKHGLLLGMHGTDRPTFGTVFYPISFVILVFWLWRDHPVIFIAAMLIMGLADALAAIVGTHSAKPYYFKFAMERKSVQGSLTMFISSFFICAMSLFFYAVSFSFVQIAWISLVVAFVATICEAVSMNGSDNLTVPLGAAFVMQYMLIHGLYDNFIFSVGIGMAVVLALLSYKAKFLNAGGAAASILLGTLIFGVGRWAFALPILCFFILSSLLSRIGSKKKKNDVVEKAGARDLWQVLANGGIAGILLLSWYFFPKDLFYILFIGSLAAVTSDTWATEIGMLSKRPPVSVINFKKVKTGDSGGISLLGIAGALLGSLLLAAVGAFMSPHSSGPVVGAKEFLVIMLAGFLASIVDSILGATVQAKFACPSCHKTTEKRIHCDTATQYASGWHWMNNDAVNGLAALAGVFLTWIGWYLVNY